MYDIIKFIIYAVIIDECIRILRCWNLYVITLNHYQYIFIRYFFN